MAAGAERNGGCRAADRPGFGVSADAARAVAEDGKVAFLSRSESDNPMFGPRHGAGGRRGESGQRLGNSRFPDAHHDERLHGHSAYVNEPSVTDRIARLLQR